MQIRTPCSPPDPSVLYEKAKGMIDRCVGSSLTAGADLSVARQAAIEATQDFQAMVTQATASAAMSQVIPWKCPRCGVLLGYHDTQQKKVVWPEGVVDYYRGRYRCGRCGEEYVPADELNDLERGGFSLDAKEAVATEAGGGTYRQAVDDVGPELPVSRQTAARIAEEVAGWHKAEQQASTEGVLGDRDEPGPMPTGEGIPLASTWQAKELPADAAVCVSVDGGMIRTCEKGADGDLEWKEGRVGTLSVVSEGRELPREKAGGKLFLGRVLTARQMVELLSVAWALLPQAVRMLPLVFVADGGPWWEWVSVYFPNAVQILDIFHAAEHCVKAAVCCFGERSGEVQRWRAQAQGWLKEPGKLEWMIGELYRARPSVVSDRKGHHEVLKAIRYLRQHRHRMRYWEYEEKGLPIGSGGIESAIDQVMVTRLRGPGMKWNLAHADDMLCLRGALLSGEIPAIIQRRKAACREKIRRYLEPLQQAV